MSSAYVLVAFAVCILLMILFISKWKIHPVTSILVATIILAISIGTPWDKIEGIINKGMADTLKSIAIVIVLGCILGSVAGFAVSLLELGVLLSIALMIVISSLASGRFRAREVAVLTVFMCLLCWVIFIFGVGLQVPVLPAFL